MNAASYVGIAIALVAGTVGAWIAYRYWEK